MKIRIKDQKRWEKAYNDGWLAGNKSGKADMEAHYQTVLASMMRAATIREARRIYEDNGGVPIMPPVTLPDHRLRGRR